MELSAEYGFHLISSSSSTLAYSFSNTHNCFTLLHTAKSFCGPPSGSNSLLGLKKPILPIRRQAGQKLKCVQLTGYCTVQKEARDVSNHSSVAQSKISGKCLIKDRTVASAPSRDFDPASPTDMPFDLLSNAPTYPSSVDKRLSFKDGSRAVSGDSFISPRQIFRSIGSRPVPSRPSIPGTFSKYSKKSSDTETWKSKLPVLETDEAASSEQLGSSFSQPSGLEEKPICSYAHYQSSLPSKQGFTKTKQRIYTDFPPTPATDVPFEFQFSYSETPSVKPLGFREPQYSPFGPSTMPRPWTGRAPLPKSKKKLQKLDSFNPPLKKKGITPVHPPGPYKAGEGPKYALTREEILGEPLTKEEMTKFVESCNKEDRQINLGRDGLVHNMLDLIHSHWKRRRVIKFKCKGVPTVDMDNVCYHIEDKTGGKIIHRAGGAVYLFRGRNYNTKFRPRIPLMHWKPAPPIYPRLIVPAPGGLTKEEADTMRKRGRKVQPVCRLAKNGVYLNLVKDVRTAFEINELVRIDCTGLSPSDYKKIGAKLKDLVPCVFLSFDKEQILVWRGKDWKPSEHKSITDSSSEVEKTDISDNSSINSLNLVPALVNETGDPSGLLFLEAELAEKGNSGNSTNAVSDETNPVFTLLVQGGGESQMSPSLGQTPSNNFQDFRGETSTCSNFSRHAVSGKTWKTQKYDAHELDQLLEEAVSRRDALQLEKNSRDLDRVLQKAKTLQDRKSEEDPSSMDLDSDKGRMNSEKLEWTDEQRRATKKLHLGHSHQDKNLSSSIEAEPLGYLPVDDLEKLLAS